MGERDLPRDEARLARPLGDGVDDAPFDGGDEGLGFAGGGAPGGLLAGPFGFTPGEFFGLDSPAESAVPKIDFGQQG